MTALPSSPEIATGWPDRIGQQAAFHPVLFISLPMDRRIIRLRARVRQRLRKMPRWLTRMKPFGDDSNIRRSDLFTEKAGISMATRTQR